MKLVLTSDFPSTTNDVVIAHIRNVGMRPRVAWVPPFTAVGRERFPAARVVFQSFGVQTLDYRDIDRAPNEPQLDGLNRYDAIYLTGGDPLGFRRNIVNSRLSARLKECWQSVVLSLRRAAEPCSSPTMSRSSVSSRRQ